MELLGKLINKGNHVQVTQKFAKREFVIETDEKYPQQILIQLTNERTALLDNLNTGELLKVQINVRGRAWTDPKTNQTKWFNSLEAWQLELTSGAHKPAEKHNTSSFQQNQNLNYKQEESPTPDADFLDLPF